MTLQRFSTADIPPPARRDAVENAIVENWGVCTKLVCDQPPRLAGSARTLPGARMLVGRSSAFECQNAPGDNLFLLLVGLSGSGVIEQEDGCTEVRRGTTWLAPLDQRWRSAADGSLSLLSISLPHSLLERGQVKLDPFRDGRLPESPAMQLLQSYATTLLRDDAPISSLEAARFASHIQDLALLVLGAQRRDETERAERRGVKAARLDALKTDIRANLRESCLSLDWLAGRHGISPRVVRDLFYSEGTSFTDYVLEARLDRVRTLLTDTAHRDRTITTLALEAGFGDLSWFYQAFRRQFGMAPSEMREIAPMHASRD